MNPESGLSQKLAHGLIILTLGTVVLWYGDFIFVPLTWGIFFAFALYPVSDWLENRRIPRGLAIILTLTLFTLCFLGVLGLVVNQMVSLLGDIPQIGAIFYSKLAEYLEDISELTGLDVSNWSETDLVSLLVNPDNLNQTIFNTGKSLTLIGIIPLYIFLLIYYKDFFTAFLMQASSRSNEKIIAWAEDSGKVIHQYLVGMVKVTLIVSVLAGIYFYLIGIKFFLLFALFIAVMNLIPYIGVIISSALVILYVFLTTDTLFYPLLTLLVLWGIQLLENNLITPVVVGGKVKVNVLAVVFAILLGGAIWGVSGMILSIPLVGILKITLDRVPGLQPYGYLLGDEFPVHEKKENFLKLWRRRWAKK
ncbi:MAG: AI-2E family transporter [Lunatimonas sp.]|uniref:AI-2E family transporter n=1 Tax=Lunatimonas sp. TaxID=2060141 RepID=UPI00263B4ABA|nr:AI-2E family transporter [Lunatimonas sp.]MCC5936369.1 AI-2E family transporter [Lunatimonas sp.]